MDLVAEPLVGFRSWQIQDNNVLLPTWQSTATWEQPGDAKAECFFPRGGFMYGAPKPEALKKHPAPLGSCTCGIYAYYTNDPSQQDGDCWGAIVAWGHIIECEHGFKAQYARPIALLEPGMRGTPEQVAATAERYDLPVLPLDELGQYALMFGETKDIATT